ncbi:Pex19-domain-containing protein [Dendrothele bispora CBS 962.96]|uniref:Pex19-domain-containing protein n=1 Tax=Dendrothele bispora (strain CBS 962.96) TaxID=1314807 RepID=A0A4S8MVZ8_DENBC|nr:Pex19-domain-containing protein [Dendrothele bispora CBS 962.96]
MSGAAEKAQKTEPAVEDDMDDMDDLDDVLSEFTTDSKPVASTQPTVVPSTSGRPRTNTRVDQLPKPIPGVGSSALDTTEEVDEAALTDEFAKELAKNMEELMRELTSGMEADNKEQSKDVDDKEMTKEEKEQETQKMMKAAWEAMLIEGMNGATGDIPGLDGLAAKADDKGKTAQVPGQAAQTVPEGDFQSRLKQTMDRLKESESNLQSDAGAGNNPESLEGLLSTLRDLGLDENGGGGDDEAALAGFLENMMGQLMSKELLHEPLQELHDKFPEFLANPPQPLEPADRKRFESQYEYVKKILAIFDSPDYNEKDEETSKKVADLMGEMQNFGSPPESIMGPLPPGLDMNGEGLPDNCVIV